MHMTVLKLPVCHQTIMVYTNISDNTSCRVFFFKCSTCHKGPGLTPTMLKLMLAVTSFVIMALHAVVKP